MIERQWQLSPPAPPEFFQTYSGLPPLIAQILYNRGITEPARIRDFLTIAPGQLHDPYLLPNMAAAVARLRQAAAAGETVAVYGDYDLDGIAATALLVRGLSRLGINAVPYIPHRLYGGYGLKLPALKKLHQKGATLVVSVDCGVTAVAEVVAANGMGLDIIITDHHLPPPELPPALAVIDPRLPGADYPCPELTGAGIAFKLLQALWRDTDLEMELDGYYDLAALGTVADIAPLLDENRYLVRRGLEQMNTAPRPGITALVAGNSLRAGALSATNIAWVLAPRLNAAGRLGHAMASYKLLVTESPEEAGTLSLKLEKRNRERQQLTVTALADAREQVVAKGLRPLLFAVSPEYPAGIVGLVAGRLGDEFYRPAVAVSVGPEISTGSCRSIPGFNIAAAITECRHLLADFGGHHQAAGFSLPTEKLLELEQSLGEIAARELDGRDLKPVLEIDGEMDLDGLKAGAFRAVAKLAPFGEGNPLPVFMSRGVKVSTGETMGKNGEHLRLKLDGGGRTWEAVAFGAGPRLAETKEGLDIVYNLEIDWWGGNERFRLMLRDFAPAAAGKGG